MDGTQRQFLDDLLTAPGPAGYETRPQRVWVDYVSEFADEVRTDAYGNAVAVHDGGEGPELAVVGHADQIGFVVTKVTDEGFLRIGPVGGADRTVSKGQHVTVHADDGPVAGVIGQTAIHLREVGKEEYDDIREQHVDVGADDEADARSVVSVGDPVTVVSQVRDLRGGRLSAPGMDNRVGVWTAAEALRRATERDAGATLYAVSTVQEEVGLKGAQMVGFDLDPDAAVAVDVTHASDNPSHPSDYPNEVSLGEGPVLSRGSTNHPELVAALREAAGDLPVQLQATGTRSGTDADGIFVQRGGIPSTYVGIPNRYMHTPVEVVDLADLEAAADLVASLAVEAAGRDGFAVEL